MAISAKTMQFHFGDIYSKLGVRNRLQLANPAARGIRATEPGQTT
jgi:DNA-binding CsgD family transcriptional regulator